MDPPAITVTINTASWSVLSVVYLFQVNKFGVQPTITMTSSGPVISAGIIMFQLWYIFKLNCLAP